MALGIDPVRRRIGWPDPLLIAAVAFTGIYLVAAARRFGRAVPIALVGLVFLLFGVKNMRDFFEPQSLARSQEHVVADAINRVGASGPVGCIGYDSTHRELLPPPELPVLRAGPLRRLRARPDAAVRRPGDQRRT